MDAAILDKFTNENVKRILPLAPAGYINRYWFLIMQAMDEQGLATAPMLLMAIATIAAEASNFDITVREGVSQYNTSLAERAKGNYFDLYDNRADLGNTGKPDGWTYRGGGAIQLTGRFNYRTIGAQMGLPLEDKPELISHPIVSARALALFIKNKQDKIEFALANSDLKMARKLVNGGSHGLERFQNAYVSGQKIIGGIQ